MTWALFWLAAAIVLGAVVLLVHLATLWGVLRSSLRPHWKGLALLPPLTPVAAWRAGQRKTAWAWLVSVAAYGLVRLVGG